MGKPSKARTPASNHPTGIRGGKVGVFVRFLFPSVVGGEFLLAKFF
jgi:hypothetical protein